jgi:hypothetical protein
MSSTDRTTRRDFLKSTAAGAAGLALACEGTAGSCLSLAAPTGTAKSCIFINLVGGPSHLDTFDPKPDAPSDIRGPFRPIPTRVPGVYLSELFPKLAGMTDKFSLVRSMHHDAPPIHEAGFQLLNTGHLFRDGPEWPSAGAVVDHLFRHERKWHDISSWNVWPDPRINTGISIGHGQSAGWLDLGAHAPVTIYPHHQPMTRFADYCSMARARAAHDVFGYQFVTINMFSTVFDAPSWDCHADRGSLATDLNDYSDTVAPAFDTAFATLLTDLEKRGLLDSTLVVATGEFGRTPFLNANGGRDHWANCWTALVAGGGVKGGRVVGASDNLGGEPKDRPVTPQELVATIFHAFGVPSGATIPGPTGEPVAVYTGRPIAELF